MSKTFGRYTLLDLLGNGGMAEVYRAKTRGLRRLVALKRIHPHALGDQQYVDMFLDEANIAAGLNHANIAQIFDLGRVGKQYYIAMEHIHGRDFRELLARLRGKPMAIETSSYMIARVCAALDYAHRCCDPSGRPMDLVHRDISVQNIMLSFDGDVKIIDFGVAKAVGRATRTQTGFVKGKFAYMSPEQLRGLSIDHRSDIFSCGIVLWELLTGKRLFACRTTLETMRKVREARVEAPSSINPEVPAELDEIVLKALAKQVDDRYQTAGELGAALRELARASGAETSRTVIASWVRKLFAEEYLAEATHIADCWKDQDDHDSGASAGAEDNESNLNDDDKLEVSLIFSPPKLPDPDPTRLAEPAAADADTDAAQSIELLFDDSEIDSPAISTLAGFGIPVLPAPSATPAPARGVISDETPTLAFSRSDIQRHLAARRDSIVSSASEPEPGDRDPAALDAEEDAELLELIAAPTTRWAMLAAAAAVVLAIVGAVAVVA